MTWWFAFFANFTISALAIRLASPVAVRMGLIDTPESHKHHVEPIPLVGGISIYLSLLLAWLMMPILGIGTINSIFVAASGLLLAVGIFDDRFKLSIKLRFTIHIIAALFMVYSNVILNDLGSIISTERLALGLMAIPITVFATIGVINAMNMMDGIDGLAGLVSLTCLLLLLGALQFSSVYQPQLLLIACQMGAIGGFLLFNLRWQGGEKAQVFLGDAGSTVLGFLFAWLFISMSQGEHRAITPITALWIFAIPLIDTVGAMLRRIKWKYSPFKADRFHIHHLLMDAGFKVSQTVFIIAGAQLLLGLVGLAGLYLGIPEKYMFMGYLGVTAIYIYKISQPTQSVPMFRAIFGKTGWIREGVSQVYIGDINVENPKTEIESLLGHKLNEHTYEIYEGIRTQSGERFAFAVIDAKHTRNVKKLINQLSRSQGEQANKHIRQFVQRDPANDERERNLNSAFDMRTTDRRSTRVRKIYSSRRGNMNNEEKVA